MFLIDAIKHNVEKNFKLVSFITRLSQAYKIKTSFVSFRVMFSGGNKNFIQNKLENSVHLMNGSTFASLQFLKNIKKINKKISVAQRGVTSVEQRGYMPQ